MRLVILLVVILALVGGGGYATALLAPGMVPAPIRAMLGIEFDEAAAAAAALRDRPTQTIELEPLSIPIVKDHQVRSFLVIHMFIVAYQGEPAEKVRANLKRLVDGYISYIHAYAALDIPPGLSDLDFLKSRLLVKSEEIVGPNVIKDLLFQNVFQRPIV